MTSRSGILKNLPSWLKVSCIHIFGIAATASSHIARESSGFTWKPPSSCSVIERPQPNPARHLAERAVPDFRRRRVRPLAEKMMLDRPDRMVAEPIGKLHLLGS